VKVLVAFAATALAIDASWGAFALHPLPAAALRESAESAASVAGAANASTPARVAVPAVAPLPLDVQRPEYTETTPPLEASPPVKHPITPNGGLGELKAYF
jgi:hypothetical protein